MTGSRFYCWIRVCCLEFKGDVRSFEDFGHIQAAAVTYTRSKGVFYTSVHIYRLTTVLFEMVSQGFQRLQRTVSNIK